MSMRAGRDDFREMAKMTDNQKLRRLYVRMMRYHMKKSAVAAAQF